MILVYPDVFERTEYRVVPTDGRKHMPDLDGTWNGDAVGHWEGDTLVVETVGITEESWLSGEGYFHTYDMKVTERFRREGDKLRYEVKIEDPAVLAEPYAPEPKLLTRDPNPLLQRPLEVIGLAEVEFGVGRMVGERRGGYGHSGGQDGGVEKFGHFRGSCSLALRVDQRLAMAVGAGKIR